MNATDSSHDAEGDVSWIIVPIVLGLLIYMSIALFVWPYARPVFSLWILLFCLVFPPAFFVLTTYILAMFCFGTLAYAEPTVVVVDRTTAVSGPVVERQGRVRPGGAMAARPSRV